MTDNPLVVDRRGHGYGPGHGHRPGLALVHGWAMHSGLFDRLSESLDRVELTRLDLPGHGQRRELAWPAATDRVLAWLADAADAGWLAGWSLGGLLTLKTALVQPERLRGLILIAATPCFGQRPHWPHGVPAALSRQLAHELETGPEQVLNRFLALEVHGSASATRDLKLLKRIAFRHGLPSADGLRAGLRLLETCDLSDRLERLDLPVLLIGGRRDKLVSFAALEATAERLPQAELVRIPGAAHAPFLSDPDRVAGAITDFIDAHPA